MRDPVARHGTLPQLSSSFERTVTDIGTVIFPINEYWDNQTFADALCANTSSLPNALIFTGNAPGLFLLPDCFFDQLTSMQNISLSHVIIPGNYSYMNGLNRLATALNGGDCFSFSLSHFRIVDHQQLLTHIVWETLGTELPYLLTFSLSDGQFAETYLPDSFRFINFHSLTILRCPTLTGTLPEALFNFYSSAPSSISLKIAYTSVTGGIPGQLFARLLHSDLLDLSIELYNNALNEQIAEDLFSSANLTSLRYFYFHVAGNQLRGSIPDLFGPSTLASTDTIEQLSLYFELNQFSDSIPSWIGERCWIAKSCYVSLFRNQLNGTLSSPLFPATLSTAALRLQRLAIYAQENDLVGSVSADLLGLNVIDPSISLTSLIFDLSDNHLNDTIPYNILSTFNWSSTVDADINLSRNQFHGSIPQQFLNGALAPSLMSVNLNFGSNRLSGTFPGTFLQGVATTGPETPLSALSLYVAVANNEALTGQVLIPTFGTRTVGLRLDVSTNLFTNLMFIPGSETSVQWLQLYDNPGMTGNLPDALFHSGLMAIYASHTSLTGILPDLSLLNTQALRALVLEDTEIEFCPNDPPRSPWTSTVLAECALVSRAAGQSSASYCPSLYPAICTNSAPPVVVATPADPAIPSPVAIPSGCSLTTRPSEAFVCIGTSWTYIGNYNQTSLNVPPGIMAVVTGNLTANSIILNGLGSSVTVRGCASNLSSITVELAPSDVDRIGRGKNVTLLKFNASNPSCAPLTGVKVSPHVNGESCKKIKIAPSQNNGILSAVFTLDNSKCKVWWIVLVSVICAVIFIGVIAAVVVIHYLRLRRNRKYKEKLGNANS